MSLEYVEVAPYQALAPIYDYMMSHVDYMAWTDFAIDILTDSGLPKFQGDPPPCLLECACGTGSMAIIIAIRGYMVDAVDKSPEMIEAARSKSGSMGNKPRFAVADFLELDEENRYDGVLCLYDSVNYLLSPRQVEEFFISVRRALKPKGLFLFDICTEYNSLVNFASSEQEEYCPGFSYQRFMRYHSKEMIQENRFHIRLDSERGRIFVETHVQRIYGLNEMRVFIKKAGLKLVEETDGTKRRPPQDNSLRIHFLSRRV